MSKQQLVWVTCGYTVAFLAVVYFTRATVRRAFGALVGGAVAGAFFLGVAALGARIGWWRAPLPSTGGLLALFYIGTAIALSPLYLITWRVARHFGWRGLVACLVAAALIGPPRDYLIAAMYPEWIVFASGIAPVLAVAATYVSFIALGHGVMRLVAGRSGGDRLARRRWRAA